jgi:hypothetical protein
MIDKIDIVIQGKYEDYTNKIIEEYLKISLVNSIIVSCWEDDDENTFYDDRVKFIRNKYPSTPGTSNKNLQIVSSFSGLKECTSKYTIKTRSDQKYSFDTIIRFYKFFIDNYQDNIIFVNTIESGLLFHPSDHFYFGKTEDMISLFDIPLEYNSLIDKVRINKWDLNNYTNYFVRPETYIGAHYCSRFDSRVKLMLIEPEKYLYDYAPLWSEAHQVSSELTPKFFKPIEVSEINFSWPKYNIGEE